MSFQPPLPVGQPSAPPLPPPPQPPPPLPPEEQGNSQPPVPGHAPPPQSSVSSNSYSTSKYLYTSNVPSATTTPSSSTSSQYPYYYASTPSFPPPSITTSWGSGQSYSTPPPASGSSGYGAAASYQVPAVTAGQTSYQTNPSYQTGYGTQVAPPPISTPYVPPLPPPNVPSAAPQYQYPPAVPPSGYPPVPPPPIPPMVPPVPPAPPNQYSSVAPPAPSPSPLSYASTAATSSYWSYSSSYPAQTSTSQYSTSSTAPYWNWTSQSAPQGQYSTASSYWGSWTSYDASASYSSATTAPSYWQSTQASTASTPSYWSWSSQAPPTAVSSAGGTPSYWQSGQVPPTTQESTVTTSSSSWNWSSQASNQTYSTPQSVTTPSQWSGWSQSTNQTQQAQAGAPTNQWTPTTSAPAANAQSNYPTQGYTPPPWTNWSTQSGGTSQGTYAPQAPPILTPPTMTPPTPASNPLPAVTASPWNQPAPTMTTPSWTRPSYPMQQQQQAAPGPQPLALPPPRFPPPQSEYRPPMSNLPPPSFSTAPAPPWKQGPSRPPLIRNPPRPQQPPGEALPTPERDYLPSSGPYPPFGNSSGEVGQDTQAAEKVNEVAEVQPQQSDDSFHPMQPPPWKNQQSRANENMGEKLPEGGPHFGDPRPPRGFNSPNFRPHSGQPPFDARGRGMGRGDAFFEPRKERPWIRRGGGNFQPRPRGPMEPPFRGPRHPRQGPPHPTADYESVNPPHDCPPPGMIESQEEAHSMISKGNGPQFFSRGDGRPRQPFTPRGSRQRFDRPRPPRDVGGNFPRSRHGPPLLRTPGDHSILGMPPRDSFRGGGFRPRFQRPAAPDHNSHPPAFEHDDSRKRKHPLLQQEHLGESEADANPNVQEEGGQVEESDNQVEAFESHVDLENEGITDGDNGQAEAAEEEKEIPSLFSKTFEHDEGIKFAQGGFDGGEQDQGHGEVGQEEEELPQAKRQAFTAGGDKDEAGGAVGGVEEVEEEQGGRMMEEGGQDWEGGHPGMEGGTRGRGFRGRPRGSRGFGPRFGGRFQRPNWRPPHNERPHPNFRDYPEDHMGPPEDHMDPPEDHMDPPDFIGPPRGFMGPRGRLGPPRGHRGHPRPRMGPPRGFREPFPEFRPPHPDRMGGPRDFMGPHPDDLEPPLWDRLGPPRDHRGPPRDFRHPPHDHRGPGDMMGPPPDHMGPRPYFHPRDYDFREEEFHPDDDRHRPMDDRFGDGDRNFYPGEEAEGRFDRHGPEFDGRSRPYGDDMEMCDEDLERERGPRFFETSRYGEEPYGDAPVGRDFPPRERGRGGMSLKFESHDWNHGASPHQDFARSDFRDRPPFREPGGDWPQRGDELNEEPLAPPIIPQESVVVSADKIFEMPGRLDRPSHIVVILRGLPGSGKSHVAKIIKDKEVAQAGQPPRILALDSYFINEVEKMEKDPITGRRMMQKVEEYEYDEAMEPSYRKSMLKSFVKTLEEGFFPMVVVDAVNHRVNHFDMYWSNAKMKGFEVYVVDLLEDVEICVERNVHNRSEEEIRKLALEWEDTPPHFMKMDIAPLLTDSANIAEIEMDEGATAVAEKEAEEAGAGGEHLDGEQSQTDVVKSRWEDASDDKLDKLDGFRRKRRGSATALEEVSELGELSLTEYIHRKMAEQKGPSKKRVRWADLEAIKEEEERKQMGFVMGSRWSKVSDEEARQLLMGGSAN